MVTGVTLWSIGQETELIQKGASVTTAEVLVDHQIFDRLETAMCSGEHRKRDDARDDVAEGDGSGDPHRHPELAKADNGVDVISLRSEKESFFCWA